MTDPAATDPLIERHGHDQADDGITISVVLPCLDEAGSVGLCVKEALAAMSSAGLKGEVVVVDNGSIDGSADIARMAGARVVPEDRPGYGNALRAGFTAVRGRVTVMADADFTYDLSQLPKLVAPVLEDEADLVLGGRLNSATRATMPLFHRFLGTPVITFLVARACGGRVVRDSQSGFRAFNRKLIDALNLQSTGMELASEMLIRAARADLRIREVQTGYRARIGQSKLAALSDGWRHLHLILLLAPDVLLIGPGVALFVVGALLCVLGFLAPSGVAVGSFRWQPVFFSGIALVLGAQAFLAGAVLAYRSSVATTGLQRRFRFVGRPAFPAQCRVSGLLMILSGLAIDVGLFIAWLGATSSTATDRLGLASLAQSLLIVGATLLSFGVISRYLFPDDGPTRRKE